MAEVGYPVEWLSRSVASDTLYARAIELLEERLGLKGQPRIIVHHVMKGRAHVHIAWSRIDTVRMRAIHHDRMKLRRCAQERAAEFGTPLPPGLTEDRGAERFSRAKQPTKAERSAAASLIFCGRP
jgi:hypothetical protein